MLGTILAASLLAAAPDAATDDELPPLPMPRSASSTAGSPPPTSPVAPADASVADAPAVRPAAAAPGSPAATPRVVPAAPRASPPARPPPTIEPGPTHWYGLGILVLDGLLWTAVLAKNDASYMVPMLLSGPVVHWVTGHAGRGFASFGLRAGAGATGLLVGAVAGGDDGAMALGTIALLAAEIIDAAALARDRDTTTFAAGEPAFDFAITVTPIVGPMRGGTVLGLAARL